MLEDLTIRELEVLKLVRDGKPAREISSELGISYNMVKNHKQMIYRLLRVSGFRELIAKLNTKEPTR